jgi:xylulokinase
VLLPKDFVRLWLSGDCATDLSDAAGTSWLDVAARDWSDELLAATHLDRARMPALHEGTAATGHLRPLLASRWHIRGRVMIAAGGGDNAASACGVGVVKPGNAFLSIGTSGVLFVANDRFRPNPGSAVHAFCHALPGTWHQMGVMLSATAALEWLAGLVAVPAAKLADAVPERPDGPGRVLFLPYLAGERTPLNDAAARGVFTGLGSETGAADLARAVMEGVGYGFADCRDALAVAGTKVERATALGGGSRSRTWLQTVANILGIPLDVPADGDFGAAFGAARLGLVAAENADPIAVCTPPAIRETIEPDAATAPAYAESHARYRALYPAIDEVLNP